MLPFVLVEVFERFSLFCVDKGIFWVRISGVPILLSEERADIIDSSPSDGCVGSGDTASISAKLVDVIFGCKLLLPRLRSWLLLSFAVGEVAGDHGFRCWGLVDI